jgi:AcrR family transcriptional regulator
MARRKTVSDDDLLDQLLGPVTTHGPDGLTFSLAAAATLLSPATLVQRFGTREAMIEGILLRAWDKLDAATETADATAAPGPEGAVTLLLVLMPTGSAETAMNEGLLLLREDFRNPTLRARGKAWGEQLARAVGRRLTDDADADTLGWQMIQIWQGALVWWAFTRVGRAEDYVGKALRDWIRAVRLT